MSEKKKRSMKPKTRVKRSDETIEDPTISSHQAKGDLEPPGASRREQLARRADELAQEMEEIAAELNVEAIPHDAEALKPDREILQHLEQDTDTGAMDYYIENADPNFAYCWVQMMYPRGGAFRFVTSKKVEGWQIVNASTVNPRNGKRVACNIPLAADGTVQIGDVVLMTIHREKYEKILAKRAAVQAKRSGAIEDNFKAAGDNLGVKVHAGLDDPMIQELVMRAQAGAIAQGKLTELIKSGRVPTMEMGQ